MWYLTGLISFLLGCLCFTYDAIRAKNPALITGSILFDLGCVLFFLDLYNPSEFLS